MQTNSLDPFSVWKSIYNEMEPKVSTALQKWLESEEYAEFSGQFLATTLQMEQQFIKAFEQMMHTYTLPTLKDYARLGEMIVALENKVDELEEHMDELEEHMDERFSSLESQLSKISSYLEEITTASTSEPARKQTRESSPRGRRRGQPEEESAKQALTDDGELSNDIPDSV